MANVAAVQSVGASIASWLKNSYPDVLRTDYPCDFEVVSSMQLDDLKPTQSIVSIYLYRIAIDEHVRSPLPVQSEGLANRPLPLDLYFMFSVWSTSAEAEHTILTWLMLQLYRQPVMDKTLLSPDGGWAGDEVVHLIPADLSNEDMMRIWDTLGPDYRLSISYIARAVRIDNTEVMGPRVVDRRFDYTTSDPTVLDLTTLDMTTREGTL